MTDDIGARLQQAIRENEEFESRRLAALRESLTLAEEKFRPVKQAAEELEQHLAPVPGITLTVNPDSLWITLADREISFGYDPGSRRFVGQESAHSWYDGDTYAYRYEWDSAEDCIESLIRLCAKYVRMARAIGSASAAG